MKSDQNRAILAVILSGIILFSWQYFFGPKKDLTQEATTTVTTIEGVSKQSAPIEPAKIAAPIEAVSAQKYTLSANNFSYTLNEKLDFLEATYDESTKASEVYESQKILSLKFLKDSVLTQKSFNLEKISDQSLKGTDSSGNLTVNINLKNDGKLQFNFSKNTSSNITAVNFTFTSKPGSKGNFMIRNFAFAGTELETFEVGDDEKEVEAIYWAGIDFQYHLFALVFDEKTSVPLESKAIDSSLTTNLSFTQPNLSVGTIFIKKEYDLLKNTGSNLQLSVDFGIFSVIAIPILRALQYFYSLISNYGIAIILLTIFIRLLTFPLQYKSTKSMKKMQEVQPELKKIQAKYKDQPQKLQAESMALFKKAGANPFSGCFPLLLQMPVFFAFYKVLYNAVELVNAPFALWITDLSSKDPYYVLPVLMTVAMFFQQKLTPTTTTDATQKKVMMFMPVIFGFIMKDLPSGLNLYILVSTIIAIILQTLVLKKVK